MSREFCKPLCATYLLSAAADVIYVELIDADKSSMFPFTAIKTFVILGFTAAIALASVK